jgi:hypothetical protein
MLQDLKCLLGPLYRTDTADAVRETLLVVPGEVVGADEFDVGESAQRAGRRGGRRRRR